MDQADSSRITNNASEESASSPSPSIQPAILPPPGLPDQSASLLVLFDGVCNLCNSSVQFILKRDKTGRFFFASLQSPAGQAYLQKFGLPASEFNSFILVEKDKAYTRSTAALRVLKQLGGGWKIFYALRVLPIGLRDGVYNWIARHRYQWFGKRESCWLPTPELKKRFLD